MLRNVHARYQGGCMMLFRTEGDAVVFLGTAFLVHPKGYLLTAAHLIGNAGDLVVACFEQGMGFLPITHESLTPLSVAVVQKDEERDLALLKFERDVEIVMPDHVLGRSDEIAPGAPVGVVGYPFGFYHVYSQCILGANLSNKMLSRRGNNLLLFDAAINDGMRGAPLINVDDGRVIGVVNDRFNPAEAMAAPNDVTPPVNHFSYAVSIEYAAALLEAEGLEAV